VLGVGTARSEDVGSPPVIAVSSGFTGVEVFRMCAPITSSPAASTSSIDVTDPQPLPSRSRS
jgi:hypothetical protein